MLRSLLHGIRHLQCGTRNALPAQILPITGYNQTRLQGSDYGRFGRMADRDPIMEEDDFEDEYEKPQQSHRFQRSNNYQRDDFDDEYEQPQQSHRFQRNNNYQRDNRFQRNQFQGGYNRNQFQDGYNRNQFQGGYNRNQFQDRYNRNQQQSYGMQQRNNRNQDQNDLFDIEEINWGATKLSECSRFEYTQNPEAKRSPEEVRKFREENEIKVKGSDLDPIMSFEEAPFNKFVKRSLEENGWEKPTAIQAEAWPIILSNKNMVGICHTGSGKTLCYVLPAIEHIERQKSMNKRTFKHETNTYSPFVLVLVPTRELALQVHEVINFFSSDDISAISVFGGVKDHWYFSLRRKGVDICVATPGRLLALLKDRKVDLLNCTYMVLDEADTMLDMGFEQSVSCIMGQCRPDRQVLMWTATWSTDVQELADSYLRKHAVIHCGSSDQTPNENITQKFTVCNDDEEKLENLRQVLREIRENDKTGKVIVFANTRQRVQTLQHHIKRSIDTMPLMLHGPMSQMVRQRMMREFRVKSGSVLVATDVASRGLDVDGVDYIINFDFPPVVKTYVHRIGRCGRKDIRGTSYTFLSYLDQKPVGDLVELLEECRQEVDPVLLQLQRRPRRRR